DPLVRRQEVTEDAVKEVPAAPKWPAGAYGIVAVSPDGKLLATGTGGSVVLWNAAAGGQGKAGTVQESGGGLAVHAEGRYLAVTLALGPVYVLRVAEPPGGK